MRELRSKACRGADDVPPVLGDDVRDVRIKGRASALATEHEAAAPGPRGQFLQLLEPDGVFGEQDEVVETEVGFLGLHIGLEPIEVFLHIILANEVYLIAEDDLEVGMGFLYFVFDM